MNRKTTKREHKTAEAGPRLVTGDVATKLQQRMQTEAARLDIRRAESAGTRHFTTNALRLDVYPPLMGTVAGLVGELDKMSALLRSARETVAPRLVGEATGKRGTPPAPWEVAVFPWGRRFRLLVGGDPTVVEALDHDDRPGVGSVKVWNTHATLDDALQAQARVHELLAWLTAEGR